MSFDVDAVTAAVWTWAQEGVAGVVVAAALASVAVALVMQALARRGRYLHDIESQPLVLHIFPRPSTLPLPSLSPFCLKLETFLRVTGTDYAVSTSTPFSKKGKKPYLTIFGAQIPDSQFCIKHLIESKTAPDIDSDLDDTEISAVEAYRTMIEESIGPQLAYHRWCRPGKMDWLCRHIFSDVPALLRPVIAYFVRGSVRSKFKGLGVHSHSATENEAILNKQVDSLSALLSTDKYFMNTSVPTTLDCVAFGFLAPLLLDQCGGEEGPMRVAVLRRPNLVAFVKRVFDGYYPEYDGQIDWDLVFARSEEEADPDFSLSAREAREVAEEDAEIERGLDEEDGDIEGEEVVEEVDGLLLHDEGGVDGADTGQYY